MKLTLEVISNRSKGKLITLDPLSQAENRPALTEMDAVKIRVELDQPQVGVALIIEDAKIELSQVDAEGRIYSVSPTQKGPGFYEALFYNYFGVAIIYLDIERDDGNHLVFMGEIEVLARKVTSDQVTGMVSYILESGNIELLRAQGATRRGMSISDDETLPPQRLIEHLESIVELFESSLPNLIRSPLSSLTSSLEVVPLTRDLDIQEQGIAWLAENLSVLSPTTEPDNYIVSHNGLGYTANELQTSVLKEDTDIYENRVLHGFIDGLLSYTHQLKTGFAENTPQVSLNKADGYESFFNVMGEWLRAESHSYIRKVDEIQSRIKRIQINLQRRLPVKKIVSNQPKFTPKVRTSKLYSTLYRAIYHWHSHSSVDWTIEKLLLAINSVPKLFEVYSVLLVAGWAKDKMQVQKVEKGGIFTGTFEGYKCNVFYEPVYWRTHHVNADELNIVRTEVSSAEDSFNNQYQPTKTRSGKFAHRSPDVVLEILTNSGSENERKGLIVLDAKYTNRKLAFERDLPLCTMKYVHGLSSTQSSDLVKAMVILYPDHESPWLDFHASSYGLYGKNTQYPILGAQGLEIKDTNIGESLKNSLDEVWSKVTGK